MKKRFVDSPEFIRRINELNADVDAAYANGEIVHGKEQINFFRGENLLTRKSPSVYNEINEETQSLS